MEFYEAVRRRRTVREFRQDPVPEATVRRALAAGEAENLEERLHIGGWENAGSSKIET